MSLMLPVLVPLNPGVGGCEDQAGDDDVEGQFAPEFCKRTSSASASEGLGECKLGRLVEGEMIGREDTIRTSSGFSVVLDGQSLAVESVVARSGELLLHRAVAGIAAEGGLDDWAGQNAGGGEAYSLVQHGEGVCVGADVVANCFNARLKLFH